MAHRENLARLGEMGAMLAHEIRNPLAGIKGFGQFIHKKPQDVRNEEFAGRIVMEAQRLESLVGDLLAYARNDLQATMVLNVGEVLDQTVALLRHEAGQADIEIICRHCCSGYRTWYKS
jgi:two-component system sensor histidine kinase HydH